MQNAPAPSTSVDKNCKSGAVYIYIYTSMSAHKEMIALIKEISGQARILTIPRVFVDLTKSHRAALVLSQCVYWTGKSHLEGGWFYKSYREWREELGIPQRGMMTAVNILTKNGFLEIRVAKVNGSPTCHYRVNMDELAIKLYVKLDCAEPA